MGSSRQITVRNVPEDVARRLKAVSEARGESIDATVVRLLRDALGEDERRRRLERYATWTPEDLDELEEALRAQRTIDEALWR